MSKNSKKLLLINEKCSQCHTNICIASEDYTKIKENILCYDCLLAKIAINKTKIKKETAMTSNRIKECEYFMKLCIKNINENLMKSIIIDFSLLVPLKIKLEKEKCELIGIFSIEDIIHFYNIVNEFGYSFLEENRINLHIIFHKAAQKEKDDACEFCGTPDAEFPNKKCSATAL